MTLWDHLNMLLGLHRHKRMGSPSYVFGVVVAHCRCGAEFTMPYMRHSDGTLADR